MQDEEGELATRAWYYAASARDGPRPAGHKTQQPRGQVRAKKPQAQPQSQAQPQPASCSGGENADAVAMFDFDCNLTHADLKEDVAQLVETATAAGVREMLVPGATLEESRAAIALCASMPSRLFPTAGVHPYNAHAAPTAQELAALRELLRREDVRAAGECGLDYSPGFPPAETQREWFRTQLALACTLRKPLFLHERLAFDDLSALLDEAAARADGYLPPAVVHCFTGTARELDAYLSRGFFIGITGFVCKQTHGAALRAMVARVPLDRLVVETDAPYMGFPGCRALEPGEQSARKSRKQQYPNVPSALPRVVAAVADALGVSPQRVADATRANARRFLRL